MASKLLALAAFLYSLPAHSQKDRLTAFPDELAYSAFKNFASELPNTPFDPIPMYFSIEGEDPSPTLSQMLLELEVDVRRGSDYRSKEPKPGAHVRIERIGVLTESNATVKIGMHISGGSGATYHLELHDGTWIVVSKENSWIK